MAATPAQIAKLNSQFGTSARGQRFGSVEHRPLSDEPAPRRKAATKPAGSSISAAFSTPAAKFQTPAARRPLDARQHATAPVARPQSEPAPRRQPQPSVAPRPAPQKPAASVAADFGQTARDTTSHKWLEIPAGVQAWSYFTLFVAGIKAAAIMMPALVPAIALTLMPWLISASCIGLFALGVAQFFDKSQSLSGQILLSSGLAALAVTGNFVGGINPFEHIPGAAEMLAPLNHTLSLPQFAQPADIIKTVIKAAAKGFGLPAAVVAGGLALACSHGRASHKHLSNKKWFKGFAHFAPLAMAVGLVASGVPAMSQMTGAGAAVARTTDKVAAASTSVADAAIHPHEWEGAIAGVTKLFVDSTKGWKLPAFWHDKPIETPADMKKISSMIAAEDNPRVTSCYGMRKDPFTGKPEFHLGADIAAPIGTPVKFPFYSGIVTFAGVQKDKWGNDKRGMGADGLGNEVIVRVTGDGTYERTMVFGELGEIDPQIREGDVIYRGQKIGEAGISGRSTGSHVHLGELAQLSSSGKRVWERPDIKGILPPGSNQSMCEPGQPHKSHKSYTARAKYKIEHKPG